MASDKDAVEQMMGMLCLELPELSSMRKSEVEDVKRFMTIQRDRVRLSYDRRMGVFPRNCVLMVSSVAAPRWAFRSSSWSKLHAFPLGAD